MGDIGKLFDSDNSDWISGLFGKQQNKSNDPVFGESGTVDKSKISTSLNSSSGEDGLLQGIFGTGTNWNTR